MIYPEMFPWWAWVLIGVGAAVAGFLARRFAEDWDGGYALGVVLLLLWMVAAISTFIGFIGFIRRVWNN